MVVSFFCGGGGVGWCFMGAIWTHYQKYQNGIAGTAVVMNGHGSFSGVGAFSVVGHNGVHSNIKILEKLG